MQNVAIMEPFPSTHWTLVAAVGEDSALRRAALGELLKRYLPPMRSHLRMRWRFGADQTDDLLQGFLSKQVLEKDLIGRADSEKGRFRTFLLTALDRYVMNQQRRERAGKRAQSRAEPLDGSNEPVAKDAEPSDAFDTAWAEAVLNETVGRMQQRCEGTDREDLWRVFQARILAPATDATPPIPYSELVRSLGLTSPAQASNVLITAKRLFTRSLRSVIAEYERDENQIDAEIADLRRILSRGAHS
jgi:RNA polymerase sigma-70 factor (ECF subfamily)